MYAWPCRAWASLYCMEAAQFSLLVCVHGAHLEIARQAEGSGLQQQAHADGPLRALGARAKADLNLLERIASHHLASQHMRRELAILCGRIGQTTADSKK
eukprot:6184367-Pleurochrysis_carterae.AAC.3